MPTTYTTPETNLIKKSDLARAREIDFTFQFVDGIKKLMEALGVTRKIAKQAGTNLKAYKATGVLESGVVAEGEIIPLSKYQTVPVTFKEINLNKWRKSTSAEAITEKGYDQAVLMTNEALLKDVQRGIKKEFFDFLKTGTARAQGANFQAAIAQVWGQLQVLFEDTEMQAVYFMNQLDAADYLASAPISLQQAFGLTYIEDFLGLGTVIFNSAVPKGKVYGTAKDNIVLYYIPVNGADLGNSFDFTADETGYVGIHEGAVYNNMTVENVVVSGLTLFAERIDGVVVGTIGEVTESISLNKTTDTVVIGETTTLTATTVPAAATVTWTTDNAEVATVANGVVTGVSQGVATIRATNGNSAAECIVTVSAGA